MKIIAGYIRPDKGSVYIDRQNLQDISLSSYYQHVGYLTQEPSIFDGSVYENLTYASGESVSETQLYEAIERAHCEFVKTFPE